MTDPLDHNLLAMRLALTLARQGEGRVEPNPMVGAVIDDARGCQVGIGYHQQYGGPHAEVNALSMARDKAGGGTLFVTLEPCCHHGKTPPCADAVIAAGLRRVVVAMSDPFPAVAGGGIAKLRAAGIEVEVGLLEDEARRLTAPFCTLVQRGRPYIHAKWAMTLDGKIAASTGSSQWISNAASRAVVHQLRGRMDAILVGVGTALADDPQLTARPAGPRVPLRIVVDSHARLPETSHLVRTARDVPVLIATTSAAPPESIARLQQGGAEVLFLPALPSGGVDLAALFQELGRRRLTNVLVEGGSHLFGALHDARLIDELHVFIAPKLLGGAGALSPIAGLGLPHPKDAPPLEHVDVQTLDGDLYLRATFPR